MLVVLLQVLQLDRKMQELEEKPPDQIRNGNLAHNVSVNAQNVVQINNYSNQGLNTMDGNFVITNVNGDVHQHNNGEADVLRIQNEHLQVALQNPGHRLRKVLLYLCLFALLMAIVLIVRYREWFQEADRSFGINL